MYSLYSTIIMLTFLLFFRFLVAIWTSQRSVDITWINQLQQGTIWYNGNWFSDYIKIRFMIMSYISMQNYFFKSRYIRFHPITWHKRIGMRAAILGCRHKGECGLGFMQVNSGSSCGKIWHFEHNAPWNISRVDFNDYLSYISKIVAMKSWSGMQFQKLLLFTNCKFI